MANNSQISETSYYRLPCGKFLEDFIAGKNLNFNIGSALKYLWRAGNKDGESEEKDRKKADHYIRFEAKCRGDYRIDDSSIIKDGAVRFYVERLLEEAKSWNGDPSTLKTNYA